MVAEHLAAVRERIAAAADRSNRGLDEVTLVAVTKGQSPETIMAAYREGHRDFGENRAAELAAKAPLLPGDIRWHFIGTLQTRQAKLARPHTTLLHSLDRPRLVNVWTGDGPVPPALIQVNVAAEPQKHGVDPAGARELVNRVLEAGISCVGLMTMAPLTSDPEESRPWFRELRELRDDLRGSHPEITALSMGMTADYEVAIEEGATLIRVGRAIFGAPGGPA